MEPNPAQATKRKRTPRLKTPRSYAEGFDKLPDAALTDQRTVEAVLDISPTSVWRMVKAGTLPAPLNITARASRWRVGDLRRVLDALGAAA